MSAKGYGKRWETIEALGAGGQGPIVLVKDQRNVVTQRTLDENTALAQPRSSVRKRLKNVKRLERFRHERELIQSVNHLHLIELVDFDLESEHPSPTLTTTTLTPLLFLG
jgi:hypothetical protein